MKFLSSLLLVLGLCSPFGSFAQSCFGDYTTIINGNTVDFSGTVTMNVTTIIWDFGDGNYDYTNSIYTTHTYASPGTYQACIIVFDSLNTCADSTCHMFAIDSCYAAFYFTTNGLTGDFFGYANGGSPNTVYAWNFGDNSTSSLQNPTHTYANAGTYTVCFAYYDLVTGCADSVCMPVTVGTCSADFTTIDSLGYVFFISNSSVGNGGFYFWDFGDGNYSTQQYPSNTYDSVGTYLVCLTVLDSNQYFCDSTCHYITVTNISGVREKYNSLSAMTISPNPSDESATISFSLLESGEVDISIYDIAGRMILNFGQEQFSQGKQKKHISTDGLSPGTYFVQMNFNDQIQNCKMIVTHKQ